jgi:hypothetical protein
MTEELYLHTWNKLLLVWLDGRGEVAGGGHVLLLILSLSAFLRENCRLLPKFVTTLDVELYDNHIDYLTTFSFERRSPFLQYHLHRRPYHESPMQARMQHTWMQILASSSNREIPPLGNFIHVRRHSWSVRGLSLRSMHSLRV